MSDLIPKVHETLANMNPEAQQAYSMGLSDAYKEVFDVFGAAFTSSDLSGAFRRLRASWECVQSTLVVRGVL